MVTSFLTHPLLFLFPVCPTHLVLRCSVVMGLPIMEEDDKVPPGLKMPSDHALHAVFIRSATLAEAKDHGPSLSNFMIPLLDPKFDDLMSSLGKIALKHPKPVIYSIMSWRRGHNENVSVDILKHHASQSPLWTRAARVQEPSTLLNERKSLTSIYIMRRALIAVLSKDALGDAMGLFLGGNEVWSVQETGREASYPCHGSFLGELEPVAHGRVAKDFDTKYEHLVKGLRHVQLRVPPPEAFEEGAEFLESLAKSFANAHGMRRQAEQEEPTVKAVLAKRARTDVAQDENLLSRMERDVLQEWETKREKLTVLEMGVVTYDQDVRSTPHIKREIAHLCPAASSNSVDPARSMTHLTILKDRFTRAIRLGSRMNPAYMRPDLIVFLRIVWDGTMLLIVNVLENIVTLHRRSRMWLCPTAAFASSLLRAVNSFLTKADRSKEPCLQDLYVCSYTPSRQLMQKRITPSFVAIGQDVPHAEFAFLPACNTAVGDKETPNEIIHLAAGLQFSGFKSVVGTQLCYLNIF
ncbi:hypothetical protein EDD22DRAFT_852227 [Suillus occidentalis]|nr:hypothetical protein EDD22DRAFT_852227 [Suillus occidentalis]